MERMTPQEIRDLMECIAADSHAEIQSAALNGEHWYAETSPTWDFERRRYRLKPQNRVIWVNEYAVEIYAYESKQEAYAKSFGACRKAVRYVEQPE